MGERLPVALPSYDELARLAHDDPAGYEEWRRRVIENFINGAQGQVKARLRGIQFRIECIRRLSKSPLGSTLRIYELMWGSFLSLDSKLQKLVYLDRGCIPGQCSVMGSADDPPRSSAQIIEFRLPSAAGKPADGDGQA